MREHKYRAWYKGRMVPVAIDAEGTPVFLGIDGKWDYLEPEPPVMQFTGLQDKNGKGDELYAGDILKVDSPLGAFESDHPMRGIGVIVWGDHNAAWCLEWQNKTGMKMRPLLHDMILRYNHKIGTIYENPDLLEVKP